MAREKKDPGVELIERTAKRVLERAEHGGLPVLEVPSRSLSNVRYDPDVGFFQIGDKRKKRTLRVNTARTFAQTLRLMALSKRMIETDDFATKREAYYVSKNWGDCRFGEQTESDAVMDDVEALASREGVFREQLRFYPEEHGGSVAGNLLIRERDPETGGMFQRLAGHRFWRKHDCILIELAGVPSRATRRFVRRLSEENGVPVYCFVDCDPYGMANIYRTLKVGSGNSAHVNRFFAVPKARFLGVTPQDILDFGLEDATHPLQAVDVKRAQDALSNDPFFRAHPEWVAAFEQMLAMGVRAEQQALAKWGLNYVIDEYLPKKLERAAEFLP